MGSYGVVGREAAGAMSRSACRKQYGCAGSDGEDRYVVLVHVWFYWTGLLSGEGCTSTESAVLELVQHPMLEINIDST